MKKIVKFGAMDITDKFPELKDDVDAMDFQTILTYTNNLVGDIPLEADILVLAGGDYLYFYETVEYVMEKNNFYDDINQPYLIDFKTSNE